MQQTDADIGSNAEHGMNDDTQQAMVQASCLISHGLFSTGC